MVVSADMVQMPVPKNLSSDQKYFKTLVVCIGTHLIRCMVT